MIPITCAMLAKNAERRLKDVLDALAPFDEVLLLDNGSTDRTAEIAAQYPNVSICRHTTFDGFGNMKNHAATLARNDWIFSIDSDEIPTPELIAAIRTADLGQPENIYRISRLNHYRGRPVSGCGWSPDIIPRLYNRTFTRFSDRAVHEAVIIPPSARTATLSGSLKHYSFDSAEGLIAKMQQYSTLFAKNAAAHHPPYCTASAASSKATSSNAAGNTAQTGSPFPSPKAQARTTNTPNSTNATAHSPYHSSSPPTTAPTHWKKSFTPPSTKANRPKKS